MTIERVREFWDASPCGASFSEAEQRNSYMLETAALRYELEPHIPSIAQFPRFSNKDVLEIGCGIGADAAEFASAGARYVGIDLSSASVQLTQERFHLAGLSGTVLVANAESLPFADASFDHVYTFGVIHHSPRTDSIVSEMHRVLRPGGTFCAMVYNKSSVNYWVEIMALRRIFKWFLAPSFAPAFVSRVTGFPRSTLEGHRAALRRKMTHAEWVSMNTDGPACPLAKVYSRADALKLFGQFGDLSTEVFYFNASHWPGVGRVLPVDWLGRRWGWHRVVSGTKA